jgi:hypothetical protein
MKINGRISGHTYTGCCPNSLWKNPNLGSDISKANKTFLRKKIKKPVEAGWRNII